MGYTTNDGRVRVDFFKPSGKWYGTASVDMERWYNDARGDLRECVMEACRAEAAKGSAGEWGHTFGPDGWVVDGGTIVCLEPHHKHAHPVMIKSLPRA